MNEEKRYTVPEEYLLDVVLAFYDTKDATTDNDIANTLLRKLGFYAVQLLAVDMGFPLGDVLKKRIDDIKKQIDEKGDVISYTDI